MLRALAIDRVRLLTNNPNKVNGLEATGIAVVERVPHHMPANPHNADYLATKRKRSGHLLG
jgi:GTP cyclohydrolase II